MRSRRDAICANFRAGCTNFCRCTCKICFVIYNPSNTQNIYNVLTKERSHRQTQRCSIKDFCYLVSHCGLSDSLSATVNVVLIRTGTNKNNLVIHIGLVIKLMFLKVILRIIRITLSERVTSSTDCVLCNKNNWMICGSSVLISMYCIVYIAMRSTRSKAASIACHIEPYQIHSPCHSIKEQ